MVTLYTDWVGVQLGLEDRFFFAVEEVDEECGLTYGFTVDRSFLVKTGDGEFDVSDGHGAVFSDQGLVTMYTCADNKRLFELGSGFIARDRMWGGDTLPFTIDARDVIVSESADVYMYHGHVEINKTDTVRFL